MQSETPHAICGAKTRSGAPCKSPAMPNGRCRMHGGKSLGGLASPTLKDGRYSKFLPTRLAEKYNQSRSDPELLALRDEIALTDSRLEDLLKRVDSGESGEAWGKARAAFGDLKQAIAEADPIAMQAALNDLDRVIGRGLADYAAWGELGGVMEQRRRLVESERKRLVDMQAMISSERAMLLIGALTDIIRRNVTDRTALAAINTELTRLLTRQPAEEGALNG